MWIYSGTKIFWRECETWIRFNKLCYIKRFKKCSRCSYTKICEKKTDLANFKSDLDKADIYILKNVPSGLSSLKSKVDKLNIGKLETASVDLSKLNDGNWWKVALCWMLACFVNSTFENATGVETPKFVTKTDLAYLKSDVDKLDINQFKNVPSALTV